MIRNLFLLLEILQILLLRQYLPPKRSLDSLVKLVLKGLPGGLVVKNPPCNAGDLGSTPGQVTKIPHAAE